VRKDTILAAALAPTLQNCLSSQSSPAFILCAQPLQSWLGSISQSSHSFFSIYSYFRHVQLYKLQREASQRIYLSSLMGRRGLTTVIIRGPDTSTPWDADLKSAQAEQEG